MSISENGLCLIKHFEGLRLDAYIDPVGVWTIGYGHTGEAARPGNRITESEAEQLLQRDLEKHERTVQDLVQVQITEGEYSALVSFAFNVGDGALRGSTLLRKLNGGDSSGAAAEFERWVYGTIDGKKVVLPGLVRRRKSERHLFETGRFDSFQRRLITTAEDGGRDASTASARGDLAAEFATHFNGWSIRNFKPYELLVMGGAHLNPQSRGYGLNGLPPRQSWNNIRRTIEVLDALRDQLAAPVRTLSVYRTPAYNEAIGGAKKSQHVEFNAIDFYVQSNSGAADWAASLRAMRHRGEFSGGIGVYSTFVHLDTRGADADWQG
ncbi:glycoside hydrolase family protein [Lutibaculum baratangense]|uniref:Lysozyme n=1 Tax=Lutibaculum baratangense AMV1 TaxID=631454 RepID=V4R5W7_9HYPH|nr:glycoside hydrolase family protein [Lutibaculum baratangense]ESR27347.1 putative phage-related lysozyme [Lutibaculum baratangense AMV1]